jgi:YVTN family beta-propeller protein
MINNQPSPGTAGGIPGSRPASPESPAPRRHPRRLWRRCAAGATAAAASLAALTAGAGAAHAGTLPHYNAYVADTERVAVVNTASNTVTAIIPLGGVQGTPHVAVTPDGTTAYVTSFIDNTVSVINTATNAVTATIPGLDQPDAVAVGPYGQYAYVVNRPVARRAPSARSR